MVTLTPNAAFGTKKLRLEEPSWFVRVRLSNGRRVWFTRDATRISAALIEWSIRRIRFLIRKNRNRLIISRPLDISILFFPGNDVSERILSKKISSSHFIRSPGVILQCGPVPRDNFSQVFRIVSRAMQSSASFARTPFLKASSLIHAQCRIAR